MDFGPRLPSRTCQSASKILWVSGARLVKDGVRNIRPQPIQQRDAFISEQVSFGRFGHIRRLLRKVGIFLAQLFVVTAGLHYIFVREEAEAAAAERFERLASAVPLSASGADSADDIRLGSRHYQVIKQHAV